MKHFDKAAEWVKANPGIVIAIVLGVFVLGIWMGNG